MILTYEELTIAIVATAALGNAASAIVQALKWGRLRTAGFDQIRITLGQPMMDAVKSVFGPDTDKVPARPIRSRQKDWPLNANTSTRRPHRAQ